YYNYIINLIKNKRKQQGRKMSKIVAIYTEQSVERLDILSAHKRLREIGEFKVFLEFVDPRTDCLVQDYFTFYPVRQQTFKHGYCYLAEHQGLSLHIPSDLEWYADKQAIGKGIQCVSREVSILQKGSYINVKFNLGISPSIRINTTEAA
ncbi:hypothetical protein L1D14_10345, partial [Vibrio tubiashii]|uniref:hypothetical protein n=1 Tax=Vibrio tubiashii TaxID=29498 RepID=UPI001EFC44ED